MTIFDTFNLSLRSGTYLDRLISSKYTFLTPSRPLRTLKMAVYSDFDNFIKKYFLLGGKAPPDPPFLFRLGSVDRSDRCFVRQALCGRLRFSGTIFVFRGPAFL